MLQLLRLWRCRALDSSALPGRRRVRVSDFQNRTSLTSRLPCIRRVYYYYHYYTTTVVVQVERVPSGRLIMRMLFNIG